MPKMIEKYQKPNPTYAQNYHIWMLETLNLQQTFFTKSLSIFCAT